MIKNILVGNILAPENKFDIVIGMNTAFDDVRGIGKPFVERINKTRKIRLGTVVTFDYDGRRELHMIVCHRLGKGGWKNAEQYVRFGMDYLWKSDPVSKYSIVNIGTGRVGIRDGADHAAIRSAIASSFLPVDLYILNERERIPAEATATVMPFKPIRMWDMEAGEVPIQAAA